MMCHEPTDMMTRMISVPRETKSPCFHNASRPYGFSMTSFCTSPPGGGAGVAVGRVGGGGGRGVALRRGASRGWLGRLGVRDGGRDQRGSRRESDERRHEQRG